MFIEILKGEMLSERRLLSTKTYTATRDFALAIMQVRPKLFGLIRKYTVWVIIKDNEGQEKLTSYENISLKQLYLNLHASNLITIDIFKYLWK